MCTTDMGEPTANDKAQDKRQIQQEYGSFRPLVEQTSFGNYEPSKVFSIEANKIENRFCLTTCP